MLTRIYGISFPDKKLLKEYLQQLEEAKKRDHKILGPRLDLFSLKEEAPGIPFIHPKGLIIWNELVNYIREVLNRHNYLEIKTPTLMTKELWETSGHWNNYKQNMFLSVVEDREFAIKPMNCPGAMLFYRSSVHSYRELPVRYAEFGQVFRNEFSGALSGLLRLKSFHQDDAHIFVTKEGIQEEITTLLNLVHEFYTTFGLKYRLELSTRPASNTVGSDEDWMAAENALKTALQEAKRQYRLNPGDGAFYGPKIDFHVEDAIQRSWQCGTIQLDMALPERFDLEYTHMDGTRRRPILIHRAILGSIERFFGILIEHYAGKFPLWLSPIQVRIVPIAECHQEYAFLIAKELTQKGLRISIDTTDETVSKKIRNAQLLYSNYILMLGDKEIENQTVNLRTRDNVVHGEMNLSSFIKTLLKEKEERRIISPYSQSKD